MEELVGGINLWELIQQFATFIARDLQHCTTAVVHVPSVALTTTAGGANAKSEAIVKWPDLDTNSMASNSWQGEHLPTSTDALATQADRDEICQEGSAKALATKMSLVRHH